MTNLSEQDYNAIDEAIMNINADAHLLGRLEFYFGNYRELMEFLHGAYYTADDIDTSAIKYAPKNTEFIYVIEEEDDTNLIINYIELDGDATDYIERYASDYGARKNSDYKQAMETLDDILYNDDDDEEE